MGLEAAERCGLTRRSAAVAKGWCVALRSAAALRPSWRVLAPLMAALAAAWQPPAAKEGQGDCDFPLGPPWILLLPLETPPLRYGVGGGGALRSYAALCRCCKGVNVALRSCVALWHLRLRRDVLSADWADSYAMRHPALSAGASCAVVWPQCGQNCHSSRSGSPH